VQAVEAFAIAGAWALGSLALLHAIVWRVQRQRWSLQFAIGYGLAALIYSQDALLQTATRYPNRIAAALAVVSVVLITLGMIGYVALPPRVAARLRIAAVAAGTVTFALILLQLLPRIAAFAVYGAFMLGQALLALVAQRREPRHGHGLVFAALLLYPLVVLAAWLGRIEVQWLRYLVMLPMAVSGATVLTTGLLRAQQQAREELRRREQAEAALQSLNDTLEQRVAQRTSELHEMVACLEAFNRSVSHDLRGPLGGIAGVSRLAAEALERGDDATVRRLLAVITGQAESSARLVGDLLALARVGDADLAPQPLDLQALVRDTLEQMRLADPQGAPLPVQVGALPTVEADPGLLRQVYVNLLGNAVKFSRESVPPRIEVGAMVEGGTPVLFVRDNGVGFDAALAQRLFEPFQRLHGSRYAGHGVGLSIVKRIVERHGGRLWAQAEPGVGATFYFSLGESAAP
jgi:signal transduction histidine kinase